jgi:hypothetical protein
MVVTLCKNVWKPLPYSSFVHSADFSFSPTDSLKGHRFEFVDELEDKSVPQLSRRSSNSYMFDEINVVGFVLIEPVGVVSEQPS